VAGDLDGDGQVTYYEWRRWQRTGVAEFTRWDVNRDGFLTPRELAGVAAPSGGASLPAAIVASSSLSGSTSSAPTTTPSAGPSAAVAAVSVSAGGNVDLSSPEAQRAKNYFDALDADKDGTVTPDEFGKSRRLKPMFEKAGQPIAQPVQLPQFVQMYLAVVKSST
jgi:Ca2+-binding EF-hand superfamily protein